MPVVPIQQYSRGSVRSASSVEHKVETFVAPVGGINTRTALFMQEPQDAIDVNNFIVRPAGLELRGGYKIWQDELQNPVVTFMPYVGTLGSKLFGVTLKGIYDVTLRVDNSVEPTPDVTHVYQAAFESDTWSHLNFNTAGVNYLVCCSAGNGYWTYDTAGGWVQHVQGAGAGQIDGTDPTQFDYVVEWKERLWFFKKNEAIAWYLPVNQIAGQIKPYDFGPMLRNGGALSTIISWTRDGGDGPDDFLVLTGTNGDVVVYQGTDPDTATSFGVVGSWYIGEVPYGRRYWDYVGSDVYLFCSNGAVSIEMLMRGKLIDEAAALSYKIDPDLSEEFMLRKTEEYWEMRYYSEQDIVLLKAPSRVEEANWTYVVDTHSKAWSTLSDLPLMTLGEFDGGLFGADRNGNVYKILEGDSDNILFDDLANVPLEGSLQCGFMAVSGPNYQKIPQLVSPIFVTGVAPSIQLKINTEFDTSDISGSSPAVPSGEESKWDAGRWDIAKWAGAPLTYERWFGVSGLGHLLSLRMKVRGVAKTLFSHWRLIYEVGGTM